MIPELARTSATLLALLLILPATNAATFVPLGDLPGGGFRSEAKDISADGTTVVGWSESTTGASEAFVWRAATGLVGLGDFPGGALNSSATGVSADGSIVVGVGTFQNSGGAATDQEAFIWSLSNGLVGLGDVPGGNHGSKAYGVSADGSRVVGMGLDQSVPTINAAVWDGGPGTGTGIPGGDDTQYAFSVSADGSVIVGRKQDGSGFLWSGPVGFIGLGSLPAGTTSTYPYRVSADGGTVVGAAYNGSVREAFRWNASSGMRGLGDLAGGLFGSAARDVSAGGNVIVGAGNLSSTSAESDAFIWTEAGGMKRLHDVLVAQGAAGLDGWQLRDATGISDDGTIIAGWGVNPNGKGEAFIASISPVPAPASAWLLVTAFSMALARGQRRA